MFVKIVVLVVFAAAMIVIGILTRKSTADVNGFVLGGARSARG